MMERLELFEKGKFDLSSLVNELEALLGTLQEASEDWKNKFLSAWGVLSSIYDISLRQKEVELTSQDKKHINEAINRLKQLLPKIKMIQCPVCDKNTDGNKEKCGYCNTALNDF